MEKPNLIGTRLLGYSHHRLPSSLSCLFFYSIFSGHRWLSGFLFLRLVWRCLSSVRAAVNRFSAQVSPRITVTRRLSKPAPLPSPFPSATPYQTSPKPARGIIIKFAYESISLPMHNDRQTEGQRDGHSALPAGLPACLVRVRLIRNAGGAAVVWQRHTNYGN